MLHFPFMETLDSFICKLPVLSKLDKEKKSIYHKLHISLILNIGISSKEINLGFVPDPIYQINLLSVGVTVMVRPITDLR